MTLLERLGAARTSRSLFRRLARLSLGVQRRAALFEPFGVASRKVLVFILTRLARLPHAAPLDVGPTELAGRGRAGKCRVARATRVAWRLAEPAERLSNIHRASRQASEASARFNPASERQ